MAEKEQKQVSLETTPKPPVENSKGEAKNGGAADLPRFLSEPIGEGFKTKNVKAFQREWKFGEPNVDELTHLSNIQYTIVMREEEGDDSQKIEIKRDESAYMQEVLKNHIEPYISLASVPGQDVMKIQWLIDQWEEFSGAREYFRRSRDRLDKDFSD